ncbi:hypothetical protein ACFQLX_16620 [Streptomyces polyrhachis]|uniref:Uncharacterized protein n=1 Tax=Streptomyces polyrhachis TaxID=1282885 RepID=A0ABW2GG92_9ACTN
MTSSDRPMVPPVRLPAEADLARAALAAPLFSRAAVLARWVRPGTPVDAGGDLLDDDLAAAAEVLALSGEDALAEAGEAWSLALDAGLVAVEEGTEENGAPAAEGEDAPAGTVVAGGEVEVLAKGSPSEILELWAAGCESVIADAALPDMSDFFDRISLSGENGELDVSTIDFEDADLDFEGEAEFLEEALANLYVFTAVETAGEPVPLPALAASLVVPDDMDEPTDEVIEQVSEAMMRLDEQLRLLEPMGLVEYRPMDDSMVLEDGSVEEPEEPGEEDVARYGQVRLTPLGVYALRQRLLDDGMDAPVLGELADKDADALLAALPRYFDAAAEAEAAAWLQGRDPLQAARELLAAARGADAAAPLRRLTAQQALTGVGAAAEPALREVLDDPELGGLARVWLTEHGASDIPLPDERMVLWLTIDTLAAQLDRPGMDEGMALAELADLVEGLVAQHDGFFDRAWRVDHPATAAVLEAMGRLHPDKALAKEARKAAFKAKSKNDAAG